MHACAGELGARQAGHAAHTRTRRCFRAQPVRKRARTCGWGRRRRGHRLLLALLLHLGWQQQAAHAHQVVHARLALQAGDAAGRAAAAAAADARGHEQRANAGPLLAGRAGRLAGPRRVQHLQAWAAGGNRGEDTVVRQCACGPALPRAGAAPARVQSLVGVQGPHARRRRPAWPCRAAEVAGGAGAALQPPRRQALPRPHAPVSSWSVRSGDQRGVRV